MLTERRREAVESTHNRTRITVDDDWPARNTCRILPCKGNKWLIVDRAVKEWFVSACPVLDIAGLLDGGFTGLDPPFLSGQREFIRSGHQPVAYMVEVVMTVW